jgi:hypothetical protein
MTSIVSVSRFQHACRALVISFFLTACGSVDSIDGAQDAVDVRPWFPTHEGIVEGSPEALALLRFVNHPTTTFVVLDIDARLDKRAATGIVDHRNGVDGLYGTNDDDSFDSIAELDAIKWVGPKTLEALQVFAIDLGFIERGEDQSGEYEGVVFTVDEADAVLSFVNRVSLEVLDAILDRRAADNIVEARPILRMDTLAQVKYVGAFALTALKVAAVIPVQTGADDNVVSMGHDVVQGRVQPELIRR